MTPAQAAHCTALTSWAQVEFEPGGGTSTQLLLGDGLLGGLGDCEVATGLPGLLLDGTTELLRGEGVGAAMTGVTAGLL